MRHSLTCRCEPCLDRLFNRWMVEARQGLRCPDCLVPSTNVAHLRSCRSAGRPAPAMATNGQAARERARAARHVGV